MKFNPILTAQIIATLLGVTSLCAGTPEQEQAFLDKYKVAFEAGDKATLNSFLYTQGANPVVLDFYKMMQVDGAGGKMTKIELVELSPEDTQKAGAVMDGPGGVKMKLPLKPTKKLKFSFTTKTADSSSTASSETFVAEKDGKFVIPVPVNAK